MYSIYRLQIEITHPSHFSQKILWYNIRPALNFLELIRIWFRGCDTYSLFYLKKSISNEKSWLTLMNAFKKCSSFLSFIVMSRSLPITRSNSSCSFCWICRDPTHVNSIYSFLSHGLLSQTRLKGLSEIFIKKLVQMTFNNTKKNPDDIQQHWPLIRAQLANVFRICLYSISNVDYSNVD